MKLEDSLTEVERTERSRFMRHLAAQVKSGEMTLEDAAASIAADPRHKLNLADATDLIWKMIGRPPSP